MVIKRFEDIIAWRKGQDLAVSVYAIFGGLRDFGFKDQICRAVVSVSNNIAEGFERGSDADFRRFLVVAKGSASEVKSMLYLAERLQYVNTPQRDTLIEQTDEIRKILSGLIRHLNANP
jgi:four helix bundle protein